MLKHIQIFETRDLNYLKPYYDKATSLGFKLNFTNNTHLQHNKLYQEFLNLYQHYSVNPPEFEIACFARYFAIASILTSDEPFLLTDTDVYITQSFRAIQGYDLKDTFVGSEAFDSNGSVEHISPHCTFWNRALLMDFLQFTLDTYKRNQKDNFLGKYHRTINQKFGPSTISDMNLIYLWIKTNKVPHINSNSTKFEFGIDHNIATTLCEDDEFESLFGRKYLKIKGDTITCALKSGKGQDMALLHFQGTYKGILKKFYAGSRLKFNYF